jgi:hypothetical protein
MKDFKLSFGLGSDEDSIELINQNGEHVATVDIDPVIETAENICLAVNNYNELLKCLVTWQQWADIQNDISEERLPRIYDRAKLLIKSLSHTIEQ